MSVTNVDNLVSKDLKTSKNKTKYFRLRLDEVSSERPNKNLGLTWD